MKRSLTLRREALSELTDGDLAGVVGADAIPSGATCPVADCLTGVVCNLTYQPRCF